MFYSLTNVTTHSRSSAVSWTGSFDSLSRTCFSCGSSSINTELKFDSVRFCESLWICDSLKNQTSIASHLSVIWIVTRYFRPDLSVMDSSFGSIWWVSAISSCQGVWHWFVLCSRAESTRAGASASGQINCSWNNTRALSQPCSCQSSCLSLLSAGRHLMSACCLLTHWKSSCRSVFAWLQSCCFD